MDVVASCPDVARFIADLFVYAGVWVGGAVVVAMFVGDGLYDLGKRFFLFLFARSVARVPFAERVRMLEAREEQAAVFRRRIRERIAREDQRHGGEL
jgi:hypothetical protein